MKDKQRESSVCRNEKTAKDKYGITFEYMKEMKRITINLDYRKYVR